MTQDDAIQLPLVLVGSDDVPILFVNHVIVQHEKTEFIITFGQMAPPILIGTPEERREQASRITSVPVKVVAKIGLTHQRMTEFVQALQENLQNYEKRRE